MPQPVDPNLLQTASKQASEWFVQLSSGTITPEQQQAFAQWLAQSPTHQQAWHDTQIIWQGFEQLSNADIAELKTNTLPAAIDPVLLNTKLFKLNLSTGSEVSTSPMRTAVDVSQDCINKRFFAPSRYAFSAVILLLVAMFFKQPFWYADYYTSTVESKQITLSDGSTVELDADSVISVDYTNNRRQVKLYHGEAFFTVAADTARPFAVLAGETEIQALGTAFDVNHDGDDIQVTVFEHAVRVTANNEQIDKLSSGNAVSFKYNHLGKIIPQNLATIDSWRQHRLIFEDKKLGEVVKALNRYRRMPIIMFGSEAKNLPVTGLFDTHDTDTALQTIEETLAVKIRRLPGGIVLLSAA